MTRTEATLLVLRRLQSGPATTQELLTLTRKKHPKTIRRYAGEIKDAGWAVRWDAGEWRLA